MGEAKPLAELIDKTLNLGYYAEYKWYLEQECKCNVTYWGYSSIRIVFPPGAVEFPTPQQPNLSYYHESIVQLPNGIKLKLVVRDMERAHKLVSLILPESTYNKPKNVGYRRYERA